MSLPLQLVFPGCCVHHKLASIRIWLSAAIPSVVKVTKTFFTSSLQLKQNKLERFCRIGTGREY
jgi:hypothetical protein